MYDNLPEKEVLERMSSRQKIQVNPVLDTKIIGKLRDLVNQIYIDEKVKDYILDIEELASIFHLPNLSVETPTVDWTRSKKGEPPLNLTSENVTIMGKTFFRDHEMKFGIKKADRRKHVYMIGKTGVGKSTLIQNMIIQDMRNGEGVAVLDPHGQLIDELLEFVPENRLDDVVIFNPADQDNPVSLNMLELIDPRQRTLIGDTLVDVFKKYFAESWGPRLEYILKNCILTLLEVPNTSLLSVVRMLVDRDYRKYIVNLISDPQMKKYWNEEFAKMENNDRLITEAIAPIQNKVGQFLNSELIRNIVGQPKSSIKVDDIINQKKLFFVNLSSGRIGANNTSLLGAMIVSQLQFAAMRRVDIPEEQPPKPAAEETGYEWALKSKCDPIPDVEWWKNKTHVSIAIYVGQKHDGDWKAYINQWYRRLLNLQKIHGKKSGAIVTTGIVLRGDELNTYIKKTRIRLSIIRCLAKEAKEFSFGK